MSLLVVGSWLIHPGKDLGLESFMKTVRVTASLFKSVIEGNW